MNFVVALRATVITLCALALGGALADAKISGWSLFSTYAVAVSLTGIGGVAYELSRERARADDEESDA